jgi:hypothetical protein
LSNASPIFCDRCLAILKPGDGNFYVVAIDAMADPTPPRLDHDMRSDRDLQQEIRELIHQLEDMSEREAVDRAVAPVLAALRIARRRRRIGLARRRRARRFLPARDR